MTINERLAVLDGYTCNQEFGWVTAAGWIDPNNSPSSVTGGIPDYLNDWNALKRLEGKAREKGEDLYMQSLYNVVWVDTWDGTHEGLLEVSLKAVIAATPEQVAEAVLAVLED